MPPAIVFASLDPPNHQAFCSVATMHASHSQLCLKTCYSPVRLLRSYAHTTASRYCSPYGILVQHQSIGSHAQGFHSGPVCLKSFRRLPAEFSFRFSEVW